MKKSHAQLIREQQSKELANLIEWAGNMTTLADLLSVTPQAVSAWASRGRISALKAVDVELLTNGEFGKESLRPDVINWSK
tara:strand:- start:2090 stop:2332 length:243 start_codon:yes stop_codon:yes gene_type:complete